MTELCNLRNDWQIFETYSHLPKSLHYGKSSFEIMTPLSIENQVDILDAIIFKNIHPMRLCQMFQML